ncbi:protein naked cuticle homolog [Coccinella septempunctata]|uniref:protein naked cuticle homolog n=1 Tax=Coccinella septempunctata TaxID=41139 RepID=UPI001D07C0C1|nr:protein naked cuticle homolog [Coccinella septempunctata]
MDVWISFYNTHMANNIVKWWRTKFLNGYKQFSGDCGDVKVSDTEELLGRYDSEDENFERIRNLSTPCQERLSRRSSRSTSVDEEPTPKTESPRRIKLEELICDVSMDNSDPSRQEKQEFSFTLYDFDGHGKITKDDIAGLVTTIYEAIGSSVKVPHCGSKTIKVKLTVSPEKQTPENTKAETENTKTPNIRYKKDINVTIRQDLNEKNECYNGNSKSRRRHHCCKRIEKLRQKHHNCCKKEAENEENTEDCSDAYSRLSSASSSEDECEHDLISDQEQTTQKVKQKRYTKKANSRYTIPTSFLKDIYKQQRNFTKNKKERNRSSSLQRKELLEIIQANMEKNNLSFQTIGKHCAPEMKQPETKHEHRHHKTTTKTDSTFNSYINNTQFYVDLASLQNATQLPTSYRYDKLIDAVIGVTNKRNAMNNQTKHNKKHHRINSECENHQDSKINEDNAKASPHSKKCHDSSTKKNSKRSQGVTGHTSSPHYLKHRNRQEDQARAMAQVVRWLEQEFSANLTMKNRWERAYQHGFSSEKENTNCPNSPKNVERHEHHHVHEHIHHHYHHYQETPIL